MPFVGAIPAPTRDYFGRTCRVLEDRTVVIGGSGNFTFERVLSSQVSKATVLSNDVSLYSSLLGAALTGQELPVRLVSEKHDWLAPYLNNTLDALATVALLMDYGEALYRKTDHAKRMFVAFRRKMPELHAQTREKLAGQIAETRVSQYFARDVQEHFMACAADYDEPVFVSFMPTYEGGYEKLYEFIDATLDWAEPSYPMLDMERKAEIVAWMAQRDYIHVDDAPRAGLKLVAVAEQRARRPVYVYSNVLKELGNARHHLGMTERRFPRIGEYELTADSQVSIEPVSCPEIMFYKEQLMVGVQWKAMGTYGLAVVIDERLAGFLEFSLPRYGSPFGLYMMSDFALPSVYKRLSKLMVMVALAEETIDYLERVAKRRIRSISTTAFTPKPVSMKYRAVLELTKRGEQDDGTPFIQYNGVPSRKSLQETYQAWWTRHSKYRRNSQS